MSDARPVTTIAAGPHAGWRGPVAMCLLLTAIGAALRLYRLGDLPAWRDETVVYWLGEESLGRLWSRDLALTGTHPPLFYTIHHVWNVLLASLGIAHSEATLRLPSVALGVASIPLLYGVLGRCFGAQVAALGAAFLAMSPAHIDFSRTAKSEVLVVLCLILTLGFALRLMARMERREWRAPGTLGAAAGFVASGVALVHAHSIGCLGLFVPSVVFVALFAGRRLGWAAVGVWAALNLLVVAAFVPWLLLLREIAAAGTGYYWLTPVDAEGALAVAAQVALDRYFPGALGGGVPVPLQMAGALLALLLLAVGIARGLAGDPRRRGVVAALLLLPVLFYAVSQVKPIFFAYVLASLALPLLALTAGFALEGRRLGRLARAGMVGALMLFLLPAATRVYDDEPEPWDQVAAYLAAHVRAGEPVLFWPPHGEWSVRFYWPADTTAWRTVSFGPNLEFRPLRTVAEIPAAAVADFVAEAPRVWLVTDEKVVPDAGALAALRQTLATGRPTVARADFASGLTVLGYGR